MNFFGRLVTTLFLVTLPIGAIAGNDARATGETSEKNAVIADKKQRPRVVLETSMGNITLELYHDRAPLSVANFLQYVNDGHYDGTIFHRVINGFMVQGGGFDVNMNEKPTRDPIRNEADNHLQNTFFTVAMARVKDPHSARAQFFINVNNNGYLNHVDKSTGGWGYAVFGTVVEGRKVVYQIKRVPTGKHAHHRNVPLSPVVIHRAYVDAGVDAGIDAGVEQTAPAIDPASKPAALDNDDIAPDTGVNVGKPAIKLPGLDS